MLTCDYNNSAKYSSKMDTKFTVKFKDNLFASLAASKENNNDDRQTKNMSDFFKKIENQLHGDNEPYSKQKNREALNLLGYPLETSMNILSSKKNSDKITPITHLNKHLDNVPRLNSFMEKLPLITNTNTINPYDLKIDPSRDFSSEKNFIPWEYVLKVNSHKLASDQYTQDLCKNLKFYDSFYKSLMLNGTISDRLAIDPRHNRSLMFIASKYKEFKNSNLNMNQKVKN